MVTRSIIKGKTGDWLAIIGLEIHAQISSQSKLFSGSRVKFMAPPNQLVSAFDAALPGTMPVLNKYCVEAGVLTGLVLSCHINRKSLFERKHYFYADLPAGYQITQQRKPIATNGHLTFNIFDDTSREHPRCHTVTIKQIQLEQDSGKSLHDEVNEETLVDLNRAGVGLMELVTEPDMTNGTEAAAFVQELQTILQRIGTCDGKMNEGSLRVDANISVNRPSKPPGVRTEVKNINSIRFVKKAVEFEIQRQIDLLENGGTVVMETRSLDASGCTVSMRDKEVVQDYRFMPEPNLPPLILYDDSTINSAPDPDSAVNIDGIKRRMPELPEAQRRRLVSTYHILYSSAIKLVNEEGLVNLFEDIQELNVSKSAQRLANWILNNVVKCLHERNVGMSESTVHHSQLADIFNAVESGALSAKSSLQVLDMVFDNDSRSVMEIMEADNLKQINCPDEVTCLCRDILAEHPELVTAYQTTSKKVINRLMGAIQKKTKGRINPKMARQTMEIILQTTNKKDK